MTDLMSILWVVTAIWIGWPLHVIAGRLTFISNQIEKQK